jgi:hypothetical protein
MRAACRIIVAATLVLLTRPTRAEQSGISAFDPYSGRYSAVGYLGLGTPLGGLGVELEAMPIRGWSFSAGVGAGSFPLTNLAGGLGPQVAFMVRPRLVVGKVSYGVGLGPSEGPYRVRPLRLSGSGGEVSRDDEGVVWLNGEMFIERRADAPVWWRFFAGYGREVASFGVTCYGNAADVAACRDQAPRGLPYFGFALGVFLNRH